MPAPKANKRVVDLNKMRAARLEKLGEGPVVQFGKNEFQCPPEVPFMVVEAFGRMANAQDDETGYAASTAILDAVRRLIGQEQFDKFVEENPSVEDFQEFLTGAMNEYGVEPGESEASPES